MHLISVDGTEDRIVHPNARAYGEDRAAVWLDNHRLVILPAGAPSVVLDLRTGETAPVTDREGFLVNRTFTYATGGEPTFSPYDPETRRVQLMKKHNGCQPYFSADGKWGYWMGHGGGPINRIDLAGRRVNPILSRGDSRLPANRNYLYFPMLSSCQRLFAFAASPGQHDHFKSDYDIFVCAIDGSTMELQGEPVRYSFHPGCDRFPDVFLADPVLGRHEGEAPFSLAFEIPADAPGDDWEWDLGDGSRASGRRVRHRYAEAGSFAVHATRGEELLRGRVRVRPAAPPEARVCLVRDRREVRVVFDEPVNVRRARASLRSGHGVAGVELASDDKTVIVALNRDLDGPDVLSLAGVRDRAQDPNRAEAMEFEIAPPAWPRNETNLVLLWDTGAGENLVPVDSGRKNFAFESRGLAHLDHSYALVLDHGSAVCPDVGERLLNMCRDRSELTIETVIQARDTDQTGPARIVSFSSDSGSRNFTLGQDGRHLILRLRTPQTGRNGSDPQVTLGPVPVASPGHVLVTYRPGQLRCYIDGVKTLDSRAVQGDFRNWEPHAFVLGDEFDGQRDWRGRILRLAVYSRWVEPQEAMSNADWCLRQSRQEPSPSQAEVAATLVAKAHVPTLQEINPYREALAMFRYRLPDERPDWLAGSKEAYVAEWVILDGRALPAGELTPGAKHRLVLQPFADNPQLKGIFRSEDDDLDFDLPVLYNAAVPAP
jgi:hypothetical protein